MEIIKVVSFVFVTLFTIMTIKNQRKDLAVIISLVAGILIFIFLLNPINEILSLLKKLSLEANIDYVYLVTVFKILGISYLASFCSELCIDAGERNLASKVEFAGKIFILVLAIPILMAVLDSIVKLL